MVEQFLNIINNGLPPSERIRLAKLILSQEEPKKKKKKEDFAEIDAMLIAHITKNRRK